MLTGYNVIVRIKSKCMYCKKTFMGKRTNTMYCSDRCRRDGLRVNNKNK